MEATSRPDTRRPASVLALARVILIFMATMSILVIALFLPGGSWHAIAQAGLTLVCLVLALTAGRLVRQDRVGGAAGLLIAVPFVLVSGASLIVAGSTLPLAIVGAAAATTVTIVAMPPERRRISWLTGAAAALIALGLGAVPTPWARMDFAGSGRMAQAVRGFAFTVVGTLIVWQIVRAYRRLTAIRTRLTVTSIALVLAVAAVVSTTSIVLQGQLSQERAFEQLQTTAQLKAQSVNAWVDQRQYALESLLVEGLELQRAEAVLLRNLTLDDQRAAALALRSRFTELIRRTGWFTEVFLVSTDGEVVLSTSRNHEGLNVAERLYFSEGLHGPYLEPPRYEPLVDGVTVVLARPLELGGFTYGIIAGRTDISRLNEIMAAGQVGQTGRTHLVNSERVLLTSDDSSGGTLPASSDGIEAALGKPDVVDYGRYTSHTGADVSGAWAWLPQLQMAMTVEQDQAELQAGTLTTSVISGGIGLLAALGAVLYALAFSGSISRPLSNLAEATGRAAAGDLAVRAEVERDDEIGAVAGAFNDMTAQLRDLVSSLEQRVEDRTRSLQAVTEVSRTTTSVLDPDQLLPQVVDLVRERFDLYYVGLFLLDEARSYAVLRAGTGNAGAEMMSRDWRLPAGGESMIGRCVVTGEAQIMQRVGEQESAAETSPLTGQGVRTEVRFENPYLPATRSELALPLRYGGRVIGAVTVQSTAEAAFGQTDIAVLQNLVDQVAVAVENARLFAQTQTALDRARRAQRRFEQQAWSEYLGARSVTGYEQTGAGLRSLEQTLLSEVQDVLGSDSPAVGATPADVLVPEGAANGDHQMLIPITQADQVIGVLGVQKDEAWSAEDAGLVRSLTEQLSLAAENQRLLDVTQRREAAERLVREVAARMREPVELEDVLRTAADELRDALETDWVVVRLVAPEQAGEG